MFESLFILKIWKLLTQNTIKNAIIWSNPFPLKLFYPQPENSQIDIFLFRR